MNRCRKTITGPKWIFLLASIWVYFEITGVLQQSQILRWLALFIHQLRHHWRVILKFLNLFFFELLHLLFNPLLCHYWRGKWHHWVSYCWYTMGKVRQVIAASSVLWFLSEPKLQSLPGAVLPLDSITQDSACTGNAASDCRESMGASLLYPGSVWIQRGGSFCLLSEWHPLFVFILESSVFRYKQ